MADNFNTRDRGPVTTTTVVTLDSEGNAMPAGLTESTVTADATGKVVQIIQTDGVNTWITTVTEQLNTPTAGKTKKTYSRPVKQ